MSGNRGQTAILGCGWCQVFGDTGAKVKLVEYRLAPSQKGFRSRPVSLD